MTDRNEVDVVTADEAASLVALNGLRTTLDAMPEAEIERRITLDASAAALTVGATMRKVEAFRRELEAKFGAEATQTLDVLPVYALATRQAENEFAIGGPTSDFSPRFEKLRTTHRRLMADAESLALRGFLDPTRLDVARTAQGYMPTIDSVERVVALLRDHWTTIEAHTPLTLAELDHAAVLAKRLAADIAARENGVDRAPVAETRVRIISKMTRAYEELRRMMTYLRWHQGDVDQFAPSLWASRGRRRRAEAGIDPSVDDTDTDTDDSPSPALPGPVNGGPPFTS